MYLITNLLFFNDKCCVPGGHRGQETYVSRQRACADPSITTVIDESATVLSLRLRFFKNYILDYVFSYESIYLSIYIRIKLCARDIRNGEQMCVCVRVHR